MTAEEPKQPEEKNEGVKISFGDPPNIESIQQAFQADLSKTIFTFGDTIYNPNQLSLTPDLIEHEKVHMAQQKRNEKDAALWWGKYLRDPKFRIDQEAKAYARQYDILAIARKGREERFHIRFGLAGILASKLYGSVISLYEAERLIHKLSKTRP
jgi:hypothetical protein